MDKLRRSRGAIRSRTTMIINKLDEILSEEEPNIEEMERQIAQLEAKAKVLDGLNESIMNLIPDENGDEIEDETNTVEDYNESIIDVKTKALRRVTGKAMSVVSTGNEFEHSSSNETRMEVKLPRLTIQIFSGEVTQWQSFWGQFEATIHNNRKLADIDKFNYLKSYMQGVAAKAIGGLNLTNENYEKAVGILKERFGKKMAAMQSHMHRLTNLIQVKKSSDVQGLRELYDSCDTQMKSLDSLGIAAETYNSMLYSILVKALPSDIYLEYSKTLEDEDIWSSSTLLDHLRKEVESRERTALCKPEESREERRSEVQSYRSKINTINSGFFRRPQTTTALSTVVAGVCIFCREVGHNPENCETSTYEQKIDAIKIQERCFVCLRTGHQARRCKSNSRCQRCQKRHHTSICRDGQSRVVTKLSESAVTKPLTSMMTILPSRSQKFEQIQLQTVLLYVENGEEKVLSRCLFDNAAQQSFIREDISRTLNLPVISKETVMVNPFGTRDGVIREQRRVRVTLRNILDPEKCVELELLEVPIICGAVVSIPGEQIIQQMEEKGIILTDRREVNGVAAPYELGILIGVDHYWSIVPGNTVRLGGPSVAIESIFGWSVQGPVPVSINLTERSTTIMMTIVEDQKLANYLPKFWELESLGIQEEKSLSVADQDVIDSHESTIEFKNGRYEVQLPWKKDHREIKDNLANASRRMRSLIARFQKDPSLYNDYKTVIEDYLTQGIVETTSPLEITQKPGHIYYIPHFAVIRSDKQTTKLRVVYDASSHEKGVPSINDCLISGPNLNPDLLVILIQFRRHKIALMADVEKAFLQISLKSEDRDYVRFLWIKELPDSTKPPEFIHLRMSRVLFGVSSSPFLLSATLKYHFKKFEDKYPETCALLNKNLYVDDLLTGAETTSEAIQLHRDSRSIMKAAGMNLRKWVTNSEELRERWSSDENVETQGKQAQTLKVLGITWKPTKDTFTFDVTEILEFLLEKRNTKRGVLQAAARVFDPIGFLSPFLINVKLLFQKLWILGIDWDEELPPALQEEWDQWCLDLTMVQRISIPRHYYHQRSEQVVRQEIHMFCDASTRAYGAVTYLRYETASGEFGISLISSKTRVAPLKTLTLPRLELMAALIGSRLLKYTIEAMEGEISTYRCWTDSEIVLHWIRGTSKQWKPFVGNRVSEIQSLTEPLRWSHCPTKENPGDLPSRGCKVQDLLENEIWWQGPKWLATEDKHWKRTKFEISEDSVEILQEKRKTIQLSCVIELKEPLLDLQKYQHARRVFNITAWAQRFVHNARTPKEERTRGPLQADEIYQAKLLWVQHAQEEVFSTERKLLMKGLKLPPSSKLAPFNPFLEKKIIRMGGRLQFSNLDYKSKHPYIIPEKHRLAELLVMDSHQKTMHGGLNNTITHLREEFWILRGRQLVKRIVGHCRVCKRFQAKPGSQVMAPLPSDRVTESPPFTITGVDFAGPLYIRETNQPKVYIALFTCGVTRAVHLEIVTDLSSEKFLLALRRFISRRGICGTIYSDNAKAFKRSEKDIKQLYRTVREAKIQEYVGNIGIKWVYSVERAAWWGGFWERMVRSVKTCLKRVLGKTSLNYEELSTTMTEVEAVLNSRPLTYNFSEVGEPEPLTPGHLLCGRRLISLPDRDFRLNPAISQRDQLTKKLKYRQTILNQFWNRWRNDYLLELRSAHSSKPVTNTSEFKKDDVVLIGDQNLPRQSWRLARIIETYPGRDGLVRSCSLRLPDGTTLRRAVQMLYNLEVNQ